MWILLLFFFLFRQFMLYIWTKLASNLFCSSGWSQIHHSPSLAFQVLRFTNVQHCEGQIIFFIEALCYSLFHSTNIVFCQIGFAMPQDTQTYTLWIHGVNIISASGDRYLIMLKNEYTEFILQYAIQGPLFPTDCAFQTNSWGRSASLLFLTNEFCVVNMMWP